MGKLGGCVCTYLIICCSCAHRSGLTALRVFFCVSGTLLHMSKYTHLRTYPHRYISYYLVKVQSHRHVRSFSFGILLFCGIFQKNSFVPSGSTVHFYRVHSRMLLLLEVDWYSCQSTYFLLNYTFVHVVRVNVFCSIVWIRPRNLLCSDQEFGNCPVLQVGDHVGRCFLSGQTVSSSGGK